MKFGAWYSRFNAAIEADGRSLRAISGAAGLGPNFLSQMQKTGKTPSVDNFLKLVGVLNVSAISILTGAEMSAEDEALLEYAVNLDEEHKRKLLDLLRSVPGTRQPG